MIHGMKIQEVMTTEILTIKPQDSLRYAKELMNLHGIRHLPVMDGTKLIGLISDRDIKEANFFQGPGELQAEEFMSTDVVSAPPDALVSDVVYAMLLKKVNAIPILKVSGELAGIFTSYDLMRWVLESATTNEEEENFDFAHLLPFPQGECVEWRYGKAQSSESSDPPNFHRA